jgi:hypothetical protein
MKIALFHTYLSRLGVDALKRVAKSYITDENVDELFDIIKTRKGELINKIIEKTGEENSKVAPILMEYFGCYHQHVFLFGIEDEINPQQLTDKIDNLSFSGFGGDGIKFAHSEVRNGVAKILLYVPFKISFHVIHNDREERRHLVLHTPVLIKVFPNGAIVSIMTFTKSDWATFLPRDVLDSRSHFRDPEILNSTLGFIIENICDTMFITYDFTNKSKELLRMEEVDLFSATKVEICESRHRTLLDASQKRETLKESVPDKVDEIIESPIITNVEIIFLKSVFSLPEGTRMLLYPSIGSIRISKHIEEGDLNEIQDYLFS